MKFSAFRNMALPEKFYELFHAIGPTKYQSQGKYTPIVLINSTYLDRYDNTRYIA